jgi:hypothetical protein
MNKTPNAKKLETAPKSQSTSRAKKIVNAKYVPSDIELEPDAWGKFEKLIKSAAKMGHKPHLHQKPERKRSRSAKG